MTRRQTGLLILLAASSVWGCPNPSDAPKSGAGTASPAPGTAASPAGAATNTPIQTKGPSIVRDPLDLPPPLGLRAPQHVRVDLEAVELEGQLADGTTYTYMTFNKLVPGPFLRVRVDDTVELHLKNLSTSELTHSIDLHAVTGPGGGAVMTQTPPGQEEVVTFKAIKPGLFVYHCATAMVAEHITNGMYGMILVEPAAGLPHVAREFYVMQGELYTDRPFGEYGLQTLSRSKLLAETPDYLVFNGAVGALTKAHPLQAKVDDTIRILFGVGGPNMTSSFHIIGEHFDRLYNLASLTSPPLTTVQTALVPPGGAAMVELKLEVPGRYLLVDHALSRLEKGLLGFLEVDGPAHPELFHDGGAGPSPVR